MIVMELPIATLENAKVQKCGDCQECCVSMAIEQLNPPKPMWHVCRHQGRKGCNIYGKHPPECKEYQCAWLSGLFKGEIAFRPDKLGLIIDLRELPDGSIQYAQVWEMRVKASKTLQATAVLAYLTSRMPVLLRRLNGKNVEFLADTEEERNEFAMKFIQALWEEEQAKERT